MRFKHLLFAILWGLSTAVTSAEVNVYTWGGVIPQHLVRQFEKKTGVHVHLTIYDNNEMMLAKLKMMRENPYDIIMPSSYFVERMRKESLLSPIPHRLLKNYSNIPQHFQQMKYDPHNAYSIPLIWGATGIFYNARFIKDPPRHWSDLWQPRWKNRLMLLDDPREVFAMGLLSLGNAANDPSPIDLKKTFDHLLTLRPNVKLFASEGIPSLMIDEDIVLGMAWNADVYKAHLENPSLRFIYPNEGFVVWIDCLAIPKHPPHPKEALQFIDFLLQADSGKTISQETGYAIANQASLALFPKAQRRDPMMFPSASVLKHAQLQDDLSASTLYAYQQYWQRFRLAF